MPFVPSRNKANLSAGSIPNPPLSESLQHHRRHSSDSSLEGDLPLSLSFLRKPSRSNSSDDIDELMKQNTLLNSKGYTPPPEIDPSSEKALIDDDPSPEPFDSPISLPESQYEYMHPLVRKKSGELVKSSLKLNYLGNSSKSLPATPTYKQVHFGGDIAVKYFDEADKPSSISANNSPYVSDEEDTDYESDQEDIFGSPETIFDIAKECVVSNNCNATDRFRRLIQPWNLVTRNFPKISYRDEIDKETPVFLERCFLNVDKTELWGQVAVKNMYYHKSVTVRYTFNDWDTVINVEATYIPDIPRLLKRANYDRFVFKVSVPTLFSQFYATHMSSSGMEPYFQLCIRFVTNDLVFWDNNSQRNYELRFSRTTSGSNDARQKQKHQNMYSSKFLRRSASMEDVSSRASRSFAHLENDLENFTLSQPTKHKSHQTTTNTTGDQPYDFHQEAVLDSSMNSPGTPLLLKNVGATPTFTDLIPPPLPLNQKDENQQQQQQSQLDREVSPTDKSAGPPPASNLSDSLSGSQRPEINSKSYQKLLENYCFFQGPSTVSSFLNNNSSGSNDKPPINKYGYNFY
ncbi:hypothetical protein OGAPHI_005203 [Ogataea philodendri]|uniref:CBM21 domain-containing protein n=1 Tax=Ogataea philodendri TaxID=1378263 RepID=A0A9P8T3A4_9ASCO|nr:uncharacterized protein OGAPHI_005203 [Ogataea philodendri]KAH3663800.1 hypothetical protein OGAPHI_005203 [Ogataea philodendri]